jgi:predicted ribosome quality control (RQC) complex YloA/Tae2 family protein
MKFREIKISSGINILLGKDAENNDELVKQFKGKENTIMHTVAPGSPFCVIEDLNPNQKDIKEAAVFCAEKSQDWRDNKGDVKIHVFTGKDVKKPLLAKKGTWKITKKAKIINVKKEDILKLKK